MQSAEVRIRNLSKHFHHIVAVDRISLTIAPGSMIALLGPSGCGKTTCLRMIAGLVRPSAGEIYLGDRPVSKVPVHRRNVGMLFQNYALFPHMTVAENVAFGLQMRRVGRLEIARRVAGALDLVQLGTMADRMPGHLSGGQQQRVGLARALVIEPAVLLLDEPLGALDKSLREEMQVELRLLQRRLGLTTVMVTHDQEEALTMADRVVVMRAGCLEQVGTPVEVYGHPATRFVASFIGASNFFTGRVERRGTATSVVTPSGLLLEVPASVQATLHEGRDETVTIRPESIRLAPPSGAPAHAANSVAAIVEQIVYRGFVSHYYLAAPGGERFVVFRQSPGGNGGAFAVGDRVVAYWDTASSHVLPARDVLEAVHAP